MNMGERTPHSTMTLVVTPSRFSRTGRTERRVAKMFGLLQNTHATCSYQANVRSCTENAPTADPSYRNIPTERPVACAMQSGDRMITEIGNGRLQTYPTRRHASSSRHPCYTTPKLCHASERFIIQQRPLVNSAVSKPPFSQCVLAL